MGTFQPIAIADILFSVMAVIIHIIGITVLSLKKKRSNQTIIITSLSAAEILYVLNTLFRKGMALRKHDQSKSQGTFFYAKFYIFLTHFCACQIILSLIMLTLDRLISVMSPFRYAIKAKEKSLFKFLIVVSLCISLLSGLLTLSHRTLYVTLTFGYVITLFTILFICVTYTMIALKIRSSRKLLNKSRDTPMSAAPPPLSQSLSIASTTTITSTAPTQQKDKSIRGISKHQLIAGLIALSYITFYCIPFVLKHFYIPKLTVSATKAVNIERCVQFLPIIGILADAVIYIFLNDENRKILISFAIKFCNRFSR